MNLNNPTTAATPSVPLDIATLNRLSSFTNDTGLLGSKMVVQDEAGNTKYIKLQDLSGLFSEKMFVQVLTEATTVFYPTFSKGMMDASSSGGNKAVARFLIELPPQTTGSTVDYKLKLGTYGPFSRPYQSIISNGAVTTSSSGSSDIIGSMASSTGRLIIDIMFYGNGPSNDEDYVYDVCVMDIISGTASLPIYERRIIKFDDTYWAPANNSLGLEATVANGIPKGARFTLWGESKYPLSEDVDPNP